MVRPHALALPAHEGHGHSGLAGTFWHYLLEPEHAALVVIGVLLVAGVLWRRRYRASRYPE